jgi:hypothetical protein
MIIDSTKSEKVLITECIAKKLAEHTYNITGGKLQQYSINEIFEKIYKKEIGKYMILNEYEVEYIKECRR